MPRMGGEREQADLDAATAHLDPPFAVIDLDAFDHNAADRPPIRVCLDVDASWRPLGGSLHVGARRSPVHTPAQAAAAGAHGGPAARLRPRGGHGLALTWLSALDGQAIGATARVLAAWAEPSSSSCSAVWPSLRCRVLALRATT